MNANQLAAQGIKLSMKEELIKFIQGMSKEKITNDEEKLLNALKNSQEDAEVQEKIDSSKQPIVIPSESEKLTSSLINKFSQHDEEEEETNLVFYDPLEEAR